MLEAEISKNIPFHRSIRSAGHWAFGQFFPDDDETEKQNEFLRFTEKRLHQQPFGGSYSCCKMILICYYYQEYNAYNSIRYNTIRASQFDFPHGARAALPFLSFFTYGS